MNNAAISFDNVWILWHLIYVLQYHKSVDANAIYINPNIYKYFLKISKYIYFLFNLVLVKHSDNALSIYRSILTLLTLMF